ncbi:MAG: POTRA domain-containing protein, partial [Acidobacteriota bacterium]
MALVLLAALGPAAQPGQPTVEEVQVVGGTTISAETVEYYLGVAAGEPFDSETVSQNFHRFWDSGLIEELLVESEDVAPSKVRIIVTVRERPRVSEWEFKGNKKLSTSTIKEKLDTASITLRRATPLRMAELQRIKQAIQEVYAKEGYASATIEPVLEEAGANQRKVVLKIDEGVKIRVGVIRF